MLCLNLNTTNPFFNLAVDEYLLKNRTEEYLILGINSPAVIIGKHQVAHREVDSRFVFERGIPVIRRISGGGAVYHDFGNLNFSFILNSKKGYQVNFRKYTLPVLEFLQGKGIKAGLEGKRDLKVNGIKISGNAEHVYRERVLHHGTLLFNSRLDDLRGTLRKDKSSYSTRAVESNPSQVMNLKEKVPQIKGTIDFKSEMLKFFLEKEGNKYTELTEEERSETAELERLKYRTWEWNYAYGPEYYFINRFELEGEKHFCRLFVKDGIIRECEIEGSGEVAATAKKLIGCKHMVMELVEIFKQEKTNIRSAGIFNFF